jgi:ABC-2 type transport system ATP-binding protein
MDYFIASNIHKDYGPTTALQDVSITVRQGSIFGLLGPNGAGKTTLIRIINQITAPDKGEVKLDGKRISSGDVSRIGYLPEERGLYSKMKIGEQALYLAQLKGMSRRDAMKSLKYWFEKFDIVAWWDKKVEELSKGMQQKVQFITTVVHHPSLLIFDEPFSGFDPINANLIKKEILELRDKGATIIFSTHNMGTVEDLCDHIALINKSRKILDGPVHEVKETYKSNIFEVSYRGDFQKIQSLLDRSFTILEHHETNRLNTVRIQHLNGNTSTELLHILIPAAEIVSFNEIIPSMNDVFIKVVESYNSSKQ